MGKLADANAIRREEGMRALLNATADFVPRYTRHQVYRARRNLFRAMQGQPSATTGRTLYPPKADVNWSYHDERWERVINRWEHRRQLQEGRALTVCDEPQNPGDRLTWHDDCSLSVDVPADSKDRWVYLSLDPRTHSWRNFRWEFQVTRKTPFKELQFGFRYRDFYNRYRFRHQNNHFNYDVVANGAFDNGIGRVQYPMELGRSYNVQIQAIGNRFSLVLNGETILDEFDFDRRYPRGSCAIILWEDDDETPIQASIDDIRIVELIGG